MDFDISSYLNEVLIPLAIALYTIGMFLKSTPKIPDWVIPWILLLISIIAAILLLGFSITSFIQGILACGIAVLGNQLYKQTQIGIRESKNISKKN